MHRCFTSRTKIYYSCGDDFTFDGEGLQLFGLCSAFIAKWAGGYHTSWDKETYFCSLAKQIVLFYVLIYRIWLIWSSYHCCVKATFNLCSTLMANEQGEVSIMLHLLWHGASVSPVSIVGPPRLVALYNKQREQLGAYSSPDPQGVGLMQRISRFNHPGNRALSDLQDASFTRQTVLLSSFPAWILLLTLGLKLLKR